MTCEYVKISEYSNYYNGYTCPHSNCIGVLTGETAGPAGMHYVNFTNHSKMCAHSQQETNCFEPIHIIVLTEVEKLLYV